MSVQFGRKRRALVLALRNHAPLAGVRVHSHRQLMNEISEGIHVSADLPSTLEDAGVDFDRRRRHEEFQLELTIHVRSNDDVDVAEERLLDLIDIVDEMLLTDNGTPQPGPDNNNGLRISRWEMEEPTTIGQTPHWRATATLDFRVYLP